MTMKNLYIIFAMLTAVGFMAAGCSEDAGKAKKYLNVPKDEYTKEAPDQWAGLEDEHVPDVTVHGGEITVRVNIKKPGRDHYIERIGIMDGVKIVASKEFSAYEKIFEAKFSTSVLPDNKTNLKVFARCSLHDRWTEPLKVK
jgi:desulfoferrodoxin (superoxide reductase-like protein)